jgi:hypothetical protein
VTLVHLIDWLTGLVSLGVKFIGFPSQVRHNRSRGRNGDGAGMRVLVAGPMCASYLLWVLHGLVNHDLTEVISQGVGAVTTGVLLTQAVKYGYVSRRRDRRVQEERDLYDVALRLRDTLERQLELDPHCLITIRHGDSVAYFFDLMQLCDDVH